MSEGKYHLSSTTFNGAIFTGGSTGASTRPAAVERYTYGTRYAVPSLSVRRDELGIGVVGNNTLLVAGGYSDVGYSEVKTVDAYNGTFTQSTMTELSVARDKISAASVGNYLLFAGGWDTTSSYYSKIVDIYTYS